VIHSMKHRALLLLLGALGGSVACAPTQPAAAPGNGVPEGVPEGEGDDWENFDPAQESEEQPFESFNPMRGPALSINGLRFSGDAGRVDAMISVYADGDYVLLLLLPSEPVTSRWLDACPRSSEDPSRPQLQVALNGVGDLSHNVLEVAETQWTTSLPVGEYTTLSDLHLQICGADYALEAPYRERFQQHAALARDRAMGAGAGEK